MKVGIIGCGAIANIIASNMVPEKNGINIKYFFDKDIERAENLASFAGGVGDVQQMAFDYAQIDFEAGTDKAGLSSHAAILQTEAELLLIGRRRRQQGRLDAPSEPIGAVFRNIADRGKRLALSFTALCFPVSEGDEDHLPFTVSKLRFTFPVSQGDPACVQPKLLSFQNQQLTIIPASLIHIRRFMPDQGDIVCAVFEASVFGHTGAKAFGFIVQDLNMETACCIQFQGVCVQLFPDVCRDRFIQVLPHAVARFHQLQYVFHDLALHIIYSFQSC